MDDSQMWEAVAALKRVGPMNAWGVFGIVMEEHFGYELLKAISEDKSQVTFVWRLKATSAPDSAKPIHPVKAIERPDEYQPFPPDTADLNSSDCCSGFVTQEGRDIHQAIKHEPKCATDYLPDAGYRKEGE